MDAREGEYLRLRGLLSQEELARASRFVHARHGRRFTIAHGRMRELLARRIGAKPTEVVFYENAFGKPAIRGGSLIGFNLSTSEDLAVLAISDGGIELGVDIEWVRPLEHDDLARRYFSEAEQVALAKLREEDRLHGFFRCWTLKEAVVKAIGEGLSIPLDRFDVPVDGREPPKLLNVRAGFKAAWQPMTLAQFAPAPGCVGALALRSALSADVIIRAEA
jgi:4'-phosphopantetheinyl transferase